MAAAAAAASCVACSCPETMGSLAAEKTVTGWAARDASGHLTPYNYTLSFIGSMAETEEVLNFCVDKGLTSQIEVVKMDYVNQALERLERNDVRYRFVVDVAGSNIDDADAPPA
ncbi:hypothetical protein OsI_06162 [Oryza sativa Indica Group]|uniref:Alcohol dehydrogenase-like C-terminal domain-containing protein n=1 Tax=Oryza sativa subsp. indica TaxID=39946 RepID=A2X1T2_ORYSI|nr:hypothetical protein OsI_06162 [Oryza sativa Indica Group]